MSSQPGLAATNSTAALMSASAPASHLGCAVWVTRRMIISIVSGRNTEPR